jgi:hypothetical protein
MNEILLGAYLLGFISFWYSLYFDRGYVPGWTPIMFGWAPALLWPILVLAGIFMAIRKVAS